MITIRQLSNRWIASAPDGRWEVSDVDYETALYQAFVVLRLELSDQAAYTVLMLDLGL